MQQRQNALGGRTIHRAPSYTQAKIGRVTSIQDYKRYGKIEVVFLDYGMPFPVWVIGDLDREPVSGDQVVVGYMEGRKDSPYLAGYIKNESYTSNFVQIQQDRIRMQLPVFDVGERNGDAHNEAKTGMVDDNQPHANSLTHHRAYVELTPEHALISFPYDPNHVEPPVTIKLTTEGTIELTTKNGTTSF